MQDLILHEQFELEVLDILNSRRLLNKLVFGGGTMLRLCFGLNRYSVDLDFWVIKKIDPNKLFIDIKKALEQGYKIKDHKNKHNTLLFEIRSKNYPRSLKIEIRKELKKINTENAIAYSPNYNIQVLLKVVSLENMMASKIETFLNRKEIRDVFDMEFLLKKGIEINAARNQLESLLKGIESLKKQDYSVKLGSILDNDQRKYYMKENFKILKMSVKEKLTLNK